MKMRDILNLIERRDTIQNDFEIDTMYDSDDEAEPRYGDTVAYFTDPDKAGEHAGILKWYIAEGEVHIVSIEVHVPAPFLSIQMLDQMRAFTNLPIDPGMMNDSGRRLWDLYRRRRDLG
jgi:hypothetical protein